VSDPYDHTTLILIKFRDPSAWYHFSGDSGAGTSFKAIIYLPSKIEDSYWQNPLSTNKDLRLMVKKVFITSDLGENFLPKWANWIKVVVDGQEYFNDPIDSTLTL
jgi:heat shock protein 90kDa beta